MWPRGRSAFLGKSKTTLWSLSAPQLSVPDTKQTPWRGLHRAEQPVAAAVRLGPQPLLM